MIKDELNYLRNQLAKNNYSVVFESLSRIISLAESELLTDFILIQAQFNQLKSQKRRGVLSHDQEVISQNKINLNLVSLMEDIDANHLDYDSYNRIIFTINYLLANVSSDFSTLLKNNILRRLAYTKRRGIKINIIWIDDKPKSITHELELIKSIGINIKVIDNSREGLEYIKSKKYHLIISNINRKGNSKEGLLFYKRVIKNYLSIPIIYYVGNLNKELGTPPYAFGITNSPFELFHLIVDFTERKQ